MEKTIDSVSRQVEDLRQGLKGSSILTPRELRAIWNSRLRPFWRLHPDLYRALAKRFLENGDNYLASEVADEGAQFFGDDVALILIRALATARSGAPQSAQALLTRKKDVLEEAEEAKSLLARTFKDLWKSSGEEKHLQEAFHLYHLDYTSTKGDRTFPGVNAASMALFLGRSEEARRIADEILLELRKRPDNSGYWDAVTIAECLLIAGDVEAARTAYANAAGTGQVAPAHLATTRAQARLLLTRHGRPSDDFDPCFPLPGVVAFTGHRIDADGRAAPRFPEHLAPEIKERICNAISELKAGFGHASAANGADILFLECMQEAGLETYVHLPLPEEEFIQQSVLSHSPHWLERYRAVTAKATEFTCPSGTDVGSRAFDYGNRLILGGAGQQARQLGAECLLLSVWDGTPGEVGSGGTGDCVRIAREAGWKVRAIQLPGAAPSEARPHLPSEPAHQILSGLTVFLPHDEAAESLLARLVALSQATHKEVIGTKIRLFFPNPAEAAKAAAAILAGLGHKLLGSLGLHAGPVWIGTHPLTGAATIRGEHASICDDLAGLAPGGLVYASSAFAALLGLETVSENRCEFLGYRALREGGAREPVFQFPVPVDGQKPLEEQGLTDAAAL